MASGVVATDRGAGDSPLGMAGGTAANPTMGLFNAVPTVDPSEAASPNESTAPLPAASQYPWPLKAGDTATMPPRLALTPGAEPKNPASPKVKIPPSEATNQ